MVLIGDSVMAQLWTETGSMPPAPTLACVAGELHTSNPEVYSPTEFPCSPNPVSVNEGGGGVQKGRVSMKAMKQQILSSRKAPVTQAKQSSLFHCSRVVLSNSVADLFTHRLIHTSDLKGGGGFSRI